VKYNEELIQDVISTPIASPQTSRPRPRPLLPRPEPRLRPPVSGLETRPKPEDDYTDFQILKFEI